jgi:ABC-type uncharacterized transport system substrate-binding protein
LAADLVGHEVDVIATSDGTSSAPAAKDATSTIPIVFETGRDPVEAGLVASFSRPGGNLTGVTILTAELMPKRLKFVAANIRNPHVQQVYARAADEFLVWCASAGVTSIGARQRQASHQAQQPQLPGD